MARPHVTVERLQQVLSYNSQTGVVSWKANSGIWGRLKAGSTAGYKDPSGYISIRIDDTLYKAHRLAWALHYGSFPNQGIDHLDGDPSNNKIDNLRQADQFVNNQNRRDKKTSKTLGTYFCANRNVWQAYITVRREHFFIGSYKTQEEAHQAYIDVKRAVHQGCTI
jgi:hypothetical protein